MEYKKQKKKKLNRTHVTAEVRMTPVNSKGWLKDFSNEGFRLPNSDSHWITQIEVIFTRLRSSTGLGPWAAEGTAQCVSYLKAWNSSWASAAYLHTIFST